MTDFVVGHGAVVECSPVAIFCYRRPMHLERTIRGLMECPEFSRSNIFVFCDGPRGDDESAAVEATRALAKKLLGDRAEYVFSERNRGLAASIISGVSAVLERFETVVVVEDDLVVSPYFLEFMNDGLRLYADDERVASVHGYVYPVSSGFPETFFLRGANCWGWGTWHRAWRHFQADGRVLAKELRKRGLVRTFNLENSYPYYRMLLNQAAGRNNSWAIRWHASAYLKNMLTLYPGRTLVENIGMDGSGDHCKQSIPTLPLSDTPVRVERIELEEDTRARRAVIGYMKALRWHLWRGRLKRVLRAVLPAAVRI